MNFLVKITFAAERSVQTPRTFCLKLSLSKYSSLCLNYSTNDVQNETLFHTFIMILTRSLNNFVYSILVSFGYSWNLPLCGVMK